MVCCMEIAGFNLWIVSRCLQVSYLEDKNIRIPCTPDKEILNLTLG